MDEGFSKISIICLLGALLLDQGAHLLDGYNPRVGSALFDRHNYVFFNRRLHLHTKIIYKREKIFELLYGG